MYSPRRQAAIRELRAHRDELKEQADSNGMPWKHDDAVDITMIAKYLELGEDEKARKLAQSLDTVVRENIPENAWVFINNPSQNAPESPAKLVSLFAWRLTHPHNNKPRVWRKRSEGPVIFPSYLTPVS